MTHFQTQLAQDKLDGFSACKQFIKSDGLVMAKIRVRADVLTRSQSLADIGYWRGWLHACVSDSLVGA